MSIDDLPIVILVPIALPVALLLVLGWVAMVLRERVEADTFTISVEHTVLHTPANTDTHDSEQQPDTHSQPEHPAQHSEERFIGHARIVADTAYLPAMHRGNHA